MNQLELGIVLICYTIVALRELREGNGALAFVFACYAASLLGFMAMRVK